MTDYVVKWMGAEQPPLGLLVKRGLALAAFAAAFLAASGAFDTESAPPLSRVAYWLLISAVAIVALEGTHLTLRGLFPGAPTPRLRGIGLAVLIVPGTAVALLLCKLVFGGYPRVVDYVALLPGTAGILTTLQVVLSCSFTAAQARSQSPAARILADALPLPLREARIDALEAEDHYVRVHTSAGSALVRMRLTDAITAVQDRPGLRPHRSWWVAADNVSGLRKRPGGAVLTLADGRQVPVSRAFAAKLGPEFRADMLASG